MDYHFTKGKFTEAELEKAIIELCEQQGYTYVCGEDMHRKYEDILLLDNLRSYLTSRYKGLSDTEMQKIINKLSLINATPLYLGNREAFRLVNEGFDHARDDISQVALHIDYINYDEPDKNIFKVVNQYSVQAFYDILVKVRDDHGFKYEDEKCLVLAKKIKELVDDKAQFADWSTRDDIKNQLNMDLTVLLYQNGYPPEWDEEVFEKVMEQAENFKKYT